MDRRSHQLAAELTDQSVSARSVRFARTLLGESTTRIRGNTRTEQSKTEYWRWLASISSNGAEHRSAVHEETGFEGNHTQLKWLASFSTQHASQLQRLWLSEAEYDAARKVGLREAEWDPSKHPRLGGPPNAGWFATTGGPSGAGHAPSAAYRSDKREVTRDDAPPRMVELASAWSKTDALLEKCRRDVEELPKRISQIRKQLGSGGHYAYLHTKALAKAEQDLATAKDLIPQLEAQLRELEQEYRESGFEDVGYTTWTPGETLASGRGIKSVGAAIQAGGTPGGLKPTNVEVDVALAARSVLQLGRALISRLSPKTIPKSVPESPKLQPYGGTGGGHHVLAKSAFRGAAGYDVNSALAISREELARLGVPHSAITGAQRTLYSQFAKTGKQLTWVEIEKIEIEALVRSGLSREMAREAVQQAIDSLKKVGVPNPTRIPWRK